MKVPYLSIVIPAYNEDKNIRLGTLDKVSRYLEHQKYTWEVLLVNDGSTDDTLTLLKEFAAVTPGFVVVNCPHRGKAATVISGVSAAKGSIILFSDLDQATPLVELEKLLPWFDKDFDIVIGSRNTRREGAPLLRRIMARGFMFLRSVGLGLRGISDTQCGFKAFRKEVIHQVVNKLRLYGNNNTISGSRVTAGFDIEILFVAKQLGYTIREVPVEWHYVETRRVNPLRDSIQGIMDILHIRWNALQGLYQ